MSIEFRCSRCGRLLRTGDESAGKQAQCPECGGLTMVPPPGPAVSGALPPQDEVSPSGPGAYTSAGGQGGSPFGPSGPAPSGPGGAENPYQSPQQGGPSAQYYAAPDPLAASRVGGPATGLIVTAILGVVGAALGILANVAQFNLLHFRGHNRPDFFPMMAAPMGVNIAMNVVTLILSVVILLGAIKMKNLENYGLAMTSAIIAVIPCFSPCCLLGLPFGIWALVVLSDARVKAAFRN